MTPTIYDVKTVRNTVSYYHNQILIEVIRAGIQIHPTILSFWRCNIQNTPNMWLLFSQSTMRNMDADTTILPTVSLTYDVTFPVSPNTDLVEVNVWRTINPPAARPSSRHWAFCCVRMHSISFIWRTYRSRTCRHQIIYTGNVEVISSPGSKFVAHKRCVNVTSFYDRHYTTGFVCDSDRVC